MIEPTETPRVSHKSKPTATKEGPAGITKEDKTPPPRKTTNEKGQYELCIFMAAVITGTGCSILGKVLYTMEGVNNQGELQPFDKPIFQTLSMFAAMVFGIPLHWIVVTFQLPFPGYYPDDMPNPNEPPPPPREIVVTSSKKEEQLCLLPALDTTGNSKGYGTSSSDGSIQTSVDRLCERSLPLKTYLVLALLSIFDLTATALCSMGLLYLDVSVYQMLRGSGIIFVALLRQYGLKKTLFRFQWIGILYNVLSVTLVGTAALRDDSAATDHDDTPTTLFVSKAFLGVALMLGGSFFQSLQFALEEKIMVHDDVVVPPLLLFGMEGVWGLVFSVCILYPLACVLQYEDPIEVFTLLKNTPSLQAAVTAYMLSIFGYNFFAVLVTFSLSSVWHSILDNFRPMTVWMVDLVIHWFTGGGFGEAWNSNSWIELVGLGLLLYGTGIYNAPDRGSIRLLGNWYSLGLNFEEEYRQIAAQRHFESRSASYTSLHRFMSGSLRENQQRFQQEVRETLLQTSGHGGADSV